MKNEIMWINSNFIVYTICMMDISIFILNGCFYEEYCYVHFLQGANLFLVLINQKCLV